MHFCFTVSPKDCMYSALQPAGKIILYLISKNTSKKNYAAKLQYLIQYRTDKNLQTLNGIVPNENGTAYIRV